MKKAFKGLFTTVLAIGFLAGCAKPVMHTVEFYADNVGAFYKEVEVKHGEKVAKPDDPTARENYDWKGWWVDDVYSAEFQFDLPITEDKTVYGKWEKKYTPDTRTFHLVGDIANTDITYINWNVDGTEDERSHLTKATDSNLYTLEIELGYNASIKVKQPGVAWDADLEFDWTKIKDTTDTNIAETGIRNIQVKNAGKYRIEVETTAEWIQLVRLGDATGAGVKPNPIEGAVADWGIVGSLTSWGGAKDISLKYNEENEFYSLDVVKFTVDDEFKLRTDNSWGEEFGPNALNELAEGAFLQPTKVENEVEVINSQANIKVLKTGYYSVYFDETKLVIRELAFALRGDALTTGWDADSDLLNAAEPVLNEAEDKVSITFTGSFEMGVGEFKVKMGTIEKLSGWDVSFGVGAGNFVVATAGNYTVTLVLEIDVATLAVTGVASFDLSV